MLIIMGNRADAAEDMLQNVEGVLCSVDRSHTYLGCTGHAYLQVTSIPKKCRKTSRVGLLRCSAFGLRM